MSPRKIIRILSLRSGFTLIELLVVIAILGILAMILIPVIGRVRDYSHQAGCVSNLRQIGVALSLYQTANNGEFPAVVEAWKDPKGLWFGSLAPYGVPFQATADVSRMRTQAHWYCPANHDALEKKSWGNPDYGANPWLFVSRATTDGSPSGPASGKALSRNNQLFEPANTIAIVEVVQTWGALNPGSFINGIPETIGDSKPQDIAFRHPLREGSGASLAGSKVNALFADGHVESMDHGDRRFQSRSSREALLGPRPPPE